MMFRNHNHFVLLPILILATAVVGMENKICLPKAVVLQKVMEQGDDAVGPLADVVPLINKVIDLKYFKAHR